MLQHKILEITNIIAFLTYIFILTNEIVLSVLVPGYRGQTFDFKTKIAQGIQKWVQTNELQALPSNFFKCKKIIKKIGCFIDF